MSIPTGNALPSGRGRPPDQPIPDELAALRAMRAIAARREDGPARERMPPPETGRELDMVRFVRRHPYTSPVAASARRADLVDGLLLVRYLRLGQLFEAEAYLAAAAEAEQVPWRVLRPALGVRSRQAVKAWLRRRGADWVRLSAAKARDSRSAAQRKLGWAETHRAQLFDVVDWLVDHRAELPAVEELDDQLDELWGVAAGESADPLDLVALASICWSRSTTSGTPGRSPPTWPRACRRRSTCSTSTGAYLRRRPLDGR